MNLTGIFLRDLAEIDFTSFKGDDLRGKKDALTPSALSTVGLRRATEGHSVKVHNITGLDIDIGVEDWALPAKPEFGVHFDTVGPGIIKNSSWASLDALFHDFEFQNNLDRLVERASKLSLKLAPSAVGCVGEREVVTGLPITSSSGRSVSLHILKPIMHPMSTHQRRSPSKRRPYSGRSSPETVLSEATGSRVCTIPR